MAAETAGYSEVTTILGMPVRWEPRNIFKNLWNKDELRVFPPTYFGFGWNLNLYALMKRFGFVGDSVKETSDQSDDL